MSGLQGLPESRDYRSGRYDRHGWSMKTSLSKKLAKMFCRRPLSHFQLLYMTVEEK